jgi:hypothetical protein
MADDTARICLQETRGEPGFDVVTELATNEGGIDLTAGDLAVMKSRRHRHAVNQHPDDIALVHVLAIGDDMYVRSPGRQWSVTGGVRPGSEFDVPVQLARVDVRTLVPQTAGPGGRRPRPGSSSCPHMARMIAARKTWPSGHQLSAGLRYLPADRKECDVSDLSFVEVFYAAAARAARAAVAERVWQEAFEEGRYQVREEWLTVMLRRRFGTDPRIPALARRLAFLEADECVGLVLRATGLDELLAAGWVELQVDHVVRRHPVGGDDDVRRRLDRTVARQHAPGDREDGDAVGDA